MTAGGQMPAGAAARPAAARATPAALARELRAEFLPASLLPVCIGAALAFYRTGRLDWPLFLWCLGGVAAIHSGANVLNDYLDHRGGSDAANADYVRPFTGGSRLIQRGILAPAEVLRLAACLLLAGVAVGLYLAARTGPAVLGLMAAGVTAAVWYSVPRAGLASLGLGEPAVAAAFGVLPVMGAHYVQTGALTAESFFVSLPPAALVAAVLFINQFQDCRADAAAGKRHWVVRLGLRRAARVYAALAWTGVALLPALACAGLVPRFLAWAALGGVLAAPASRIALSRFDRPAALAPANAMTVAMHATVCLAMSALLAGARLLRG